nr:hypothetical protein [Tanacetum cinerariifolium]
MSAITDIRCVLTQKPFNAFCDKFHIPREVHLVLPSQNDTMHERPSRKIVLYIRFFDYTNFRLPLSTFLVDVLRNFRINISQLSMIGVAKVSYFEILCRVYRIMPTVGLFRCFYNNRFFWVDDFACPAFFLWHTAKYVTRDSDPVAADFNAQDYTILVAHPSPFQKFPKSFLCLKWIFLLSSIPRILTNELEASVETLFDEGGSGNQIEQGDSARGGPDPNIQQVVEAANNVVEDRLLAGAVLNVEVGVAAIPTLPYLTAYVSTTPEREDRDHTDSVAESNLRTIGAPRRSSISIMTTVTTTTSTVNPNLVTKEKFVEPSLFGVGSSFAGRTDPITGVFLDLNGSDFLVGSIRTIINLILIFKKFTSLNGVMEHDQLFTEFNVEATRQISLSTKIESLKARLLLREAEAAKAIHLRAEASNFKTMEKSLQDETNALRECNVIVEKEWLLTHGMELAVANYLNSPEYLSALGAAIGPLAEKLRLNEMQPNVDQLMVPIHHSLDQVVVGATALSLALDVSSACVRKIRENIANQRSALRDVFVLMAEPYSAAVLTGTEGTSDTAAVTAGTTMVLSTTFASASTIAPISVDNYEVMGADDQAVADENAASFPIVDDCGHANFVGMTASVSYVNENRVSPLLDFIMVRCPLAEKLRLNELQPNVDQLMVPIHHSLDQVDVGATAMSLSLDVSSACIRKIRKNIANQRSALRDVFVYLAEPYSAAVLTGTEGTSDTTAVTAGTTMVLSTTFASASTIAPISIDNYEVMGADDQAVADENAASFPIVDDAKLNIPQ